MVKTKAPVFPWDYLARIVEKAPEAIIVIGDSGRILAWNRAAERLYGSPKRDMVGRYAMELLPKELRREREKRFLEFLRSEKAPAPAQPVEIVVRRKDGSVIATEVMAAKVRADGTFGIVAVARDITAQKSSQAALKEREERFRTLMKISPDAITAADLNGRITEVSDRTLKLHGYKNASELIGKSAFNLIAPEDEKRARRNAEKAFQSGYLGNAQYTLLRKDGSRFMGEMNVSLLRGPAGKPAGFMASVRNITPHRKAEARLKAGFAIANILERAPSLEKASPDILQAICRHLSWDWGELWMVDRGAGVLRCSEIWHDPSLRFPEFERVTRKTVFASGFGLPGRAWARAKPVWIKDVTEDANFLRSHAAVRAELRGAFAFPIMIGRNVLGVMSCFTREAREPDLAVLRIFDTLGHHIGQFIERKDAEDALKESEQRYHDLAESAKDSIYVIGKDMRVQYANGSACRFTGKRLDRLVGRTVTELFPKAAAHMVPNLEKVVRTGRPLRSEDRFYMFPKTERWLDTQLIPLKDGKGRTRAVMGISRDVTGHRAAEEALRDSEERFRKVFEEGRIGISMVGLDNRFIRANRALCRIVGYSESELRRMTFADITHPEEVSRDLEKARLLGAGRIPSYSVEKRYIRKDGRMIWVSLHVTVIHGKDGKPMYFLVMTEDITGHREMEDALRESEEKHRIIVENSADVVMITGQDGVLSYVSPASERVLGYKPEELVGQKLTMMHPDDQEKVQGIFSKALRREGGSNVEYRVLTKAGDVKWVSHSWSPIFSDGRMKMLVSVVSDINERKKMDSFRREYYLMVEKEIGAKNRELRQLQAELERRDKLLEQFKRFAMEKEKELSELRMELRRLK